MDQAALLSVIGGFYDKLVNDVSERVIDKLVRDGALTTEIDSRIKAQLDDFSDRMAMMDKDAIREVCDDAIDAYDIDDKVNSFMLNHFDISDYQSEILDMVEDRLGDEVLEQVKNLTFTVEVS
jgi:coenzyme F420-reducing hydrogenase alpha subunit